MLYAVAAIENHLRIVFAWLPFIEYIKPIRQMICWKRCECSVCVETSSTRTRRVRWMRCGGMPQNALKCTLLSYSATCFLFLLFQRVVLRISRWQHLCSFYANFLFHSYEFVLCVPNTSRITSTPFSPLHF